MKNINKSAVVIMVITLLSSISLLATRVAIYNESGEQLFMALVTTTNRTKNAVAKKEAGKPYAKVLGSNFNDLKPIAVGRYVELENFSLSPGYDRSLWVSLDAENLRQALQDGKMTPALGTVFEVGSGKAIVIKDSGQFGGVGATNLKFDKYTISKPKGVEGKMLDASDRDTKKFFSLSGPT